MEETKNLDVLIKATPIEATIRGFVSIARHIKLFINWLSLAVINTCWLGIDRTTKVRKDAIALMCQISQPYYRFYFFFKFFRNFLLELKIIF